MDQSKDFITGQIVKYQSIFLGAASVVKRPPGSPRRLGEARPGSSASHDAHGTCFSEVPPCHRLSWNCLSREAPLRPRRKFSLSCLSHDAPLRQLLGLSRDCLSLEASLRHMRPQRFSLVATSYKSRRTYKTES